MKQQKEFDKYLQLKHHKTIKKIATTIFIGLALMLCIPAAKGLQEIRANDNTVAHLHQTPASVKKMHHAKHSKYEKLFDKYGDAVLPLIGKYAYVIYCEKGTPKDLRDATRKAAGNWQKYTGIPFAMTNNKSEANILVKDANAKQLGTDVMGDEAGYYDIAKYAPLSSKGVIRINTKYDLSIKNDDLSIVVTHELGHALGVKHSKHPESIMFKDDEDNDRKQYLTQEDANNALREYKGLHKVRAGY